MPRTLIGNFKGPKGNTGEQGPQGVPGPQGLPGEKGDPGAVDENTPIIFEVPETYEIPVSGNAIKVLFGKITKGLSDLFAAVGVLASLKTVEKSTLVAAINEMAEKKFDVEKIVASANITEPGFVMDGKTASEAIAELYSKFQKNNVEKSIIIPSGTKITDVVLNEISERSSWGFAFIGVSTGGDIPLDFDYATGFVVHTGNTGSVILFSRRHSDMAINSYTGTNWTGWREL